MHSPLKIPFDCQLYNIQTENFVHVNAGSFIVVLRKLPLAVKRNSRFQFVQRGISDSFCQFIVKTTPKDKITESNWSYHDLRRSLTYAHLRPPGHCEGFEVINLENGMKLWMSKFDMESLLKGV